MARDITSGMTTQVTADTLEPIFLMDFDFATGPLSFWTGSGDLVWNSTTYTGSGDVLQFGAVEENAGLKATGVAFTLTGVNAALVSIAQNDDFQGRDCSLRIAVLSGGSIVADPYLLFTGYMDTMAIDDSGETASFQLSVENRLVALERANKHLYTPERQKLDYPDDLGFDQVTELQDKSLKWGTG